MVVNNHDLLQQAIGLLEQIHKDLDYLEVNLSYLLGGSLCASGCGTCCMQSFVIPGISAQYMAIQIEKQSDAKQKLITERLERWLLYELPGVRFKFSVDGQAEINMRDQEYTETSRLWCPLLDDQKKCSIYPWRDITCRAWGITRPSGKFCPRPLGEGETDELRMHVDGESVKPVLYQIAMLTGLLSEHEPSLLQHGWMPAMLYMMLEPQKWREIQTRVQQIKTGALKTGYMWLVTPEHLKSFISKDRFSAEASIRI